MAAGVFQELAAIGQSIWYDNISRDLLDSGELGRLIADGSVRGVTSNPSIFEKAISEGHAYDAAVAAVLREAPVRDVMQLYEALAVEDIQRTADLLAPVHQASQGVDGYVSVEVSPRLADDAAGTEAEARRLFDRIGRPNVMIKVPATEAGLAAVPRLLAQGLHINVTLIFSHADLEATAAAYMAGLEARAAGGGDLARVASVASFFVSRMDTAVDKLLPEGSPLRGRAAVAYATVAYERYQELCRSARFTALARKGARPQRLLWASTGTKNPAYSDLLYVEPLIGPDTVNTVPPATLAALADHGTPRAQVTQGAAQAHASLQALAASGIDLDAVTLRLKQEGVAAFSRSLEGLLAVLSRKQDAALSNRA